MKLATITLSALLTAASIRAAAVPATSDAVEASSTPVATATPETSAATEEADADDLPLPDAAVEGQYPLTNDESAFVATVDGQQVLVVFNVTLADELISKGAIEKRGWHWGRYGTYEPIS